MKAMMLITCSGFDQEIANKIGEDMEARGVKFVRSAVPTSVTKMEDGRLRVVYHSDVTDLDADDIFDTVRRSADCSAGVDSCVCRG